jgi:3-oxoacyl-[acyl-carrier protein] reductase
MKWRAHRLANHHTRRPDMDLGIKDKKAIVCAASKGLGKACAMSLARNGVDLVINARTASDLEATAAEIRSATGRKVTAVACDITSADGRAKVLAACPDPDILINNAGGPPRGDFREWDEQAWMKAVNGNMITPIMLIKAVVDGMIARKFGRIVNITSGSVKSPIPELGMSNGARAGLTGFVAGLARQVARHNVTINGLLPGPFLTDRLRSGRVDAAQKAGLPVDEYIMQHFKNTPTGRPGDPFEFGEACAFLCAASSGFIVGQNLLLDGGNFNSTMG